MGLKSWQNSSKGDLKGFIDRGRDSLLRAIAHSEVLIDYAEEDIPQDIMEGILTQLENLTLQIDNILDVSSRRKGLIDGFRVAIIGKPQCGEKLPPKWAFKL